MIKSISRPYWILVFCLSAVMLSMELQSQESLEIEIWDSVASKPVQEVTVVMSAGAGHEVQLSSNEEGIVKLGQLNHKLYRLTLVLEGYESRALAFQVDNPVTRVYMTAQENVDRERDDGQLSRSALPLQRDMRNPPQKRDGEQSVAQADLTERLGETSNRKSFSLTRLPTDFNGWTIEIYSGEKSLPTDVPSKGLDRIYWMSNDDGTYRYYTGKFLTYEEAIQHYEKSLMDDFPAALIMECKDGKLQ